MSNFKEGMDILLGLEFNSPKNALHWNKKEKGPTFMGVYHYAHPSWHGWDTIAAFAAEHDVNVFDYEEYDNLNLIAEISTKCYSDETLKQAVGEFYKVKFWDVAKLDEINNLELCLEMFIFGVNAGMKKAVILMQQVCGLVDDGVVGKKTIAHLNGLSTAEIIEIDNKYDLAEMEYYNALIEKKPDLHIYAKGWRNRANAV